MRENKEQGLEKQTPAGLPITISQWWEIRKRASDLSDEAQDKLDDAKSKRAKARFRRAMHEASDEVLRAELAILMAVPASLADLAIQVRVMACRGQDRQGDVVAAHAERFAMIGKSALPEAILSLFRAGTGAEEHFAIMRSIADALYEACEAIDEGRATAGKIIAELSARTLNLAADRLEDQTIEGNEALRALGQSLEEGGAS